MKGTKTKKIGNAWNLQGKRGQRWRKRQNSRENLAKWKENTKKRRKTHGKPKKRKKIQKKKRKKNPKLTSRPFYGVYIFKSPKALIQTPPGVAIATLVWQRLGAVQRTLRRCAGPENGFGGCRSLPCFFRVLFVRDKTWPAHMCDQFKSLGTS